MIKKRPGRKAAHHHDSSSIYYTEHMDQYEAPADITPACFPLKEDKEAKKFLGYSKENQIIDKVIKREITQIEAKEAE